MIANSRFNPLLSKSNPEFSDKELKVIKLICEELTNKEIAEKLNLSKRTVEGYREQILEKINAKNIVGVVLYAIKNKIIHVSPVAPVKIR